MPQFCSGSMLLSVYLDKNLTGFARNVNLWFTYRGMKVWNMALWGFIGGFFIYFLQKRKH